MSERPLNRAYLSLGSNIHPERNLPAAVKELSAFGRIAKVSRVWESAPIDSADHPRAAAGGNFLNAAVLLETSLSAEALSEDVARQIERKLGRVRDPRNRNAPRTIDIDLSLFNRESRAVGCRMVPDPDILTRAFVALPLADVAPDYDHPVVHRPLQEIAAKLAPTTWLRLRPEIALV